MISAKNREELNKQDFFISKEDLKYFNLFTTINNSEENFAICSSVDEKMFLKNQSIQVINQFAENFLPIVFKSIDPSLSIQDAVINIYQKLDESFLV